MDERCIQCDHPKLGHYGKGCHRMSFLRGNCDCDFVEPAPLPMSATIEQHLERAAWWTRRIDLTDRRMWHAAHGSDAWVRLDRLRKVADMARHHHLEMAHGLRAASAEEDGAAGTDGDADDLLRLITIDSIGRQPASTLAMLPDLFDRTPPQARDELQARLVAEFDALEPRHRRVLLEDEGVRAALSRMGVVTVWSMSGPSQAGGRARPGTGPTRDVIGRAMGATLLGPSFAEELAREFGATIGDAYWAQTDDAAGTAGQDPDEAFLSRFRHMRTQLETYWRHWALAPNPSVQMSLITQHPDAFRRQMVLAIGVMTPPEKSRFACRAELFGWVASGMLPLFEGGEPVSLEDVIEARYLALIDP